MSETRVREVVACDECEVYLTVNGTERLLASGRGILQIDGARDDDAQTALVGCGITLFDARSGAGFPFEQVAGEIIAGCAVSFLIMADIDLGGVKRRCAFKNCLPAPRVGLGTARDRWSFLVEPDPDTLGGMVFGKRGAADGGA